MSAVKQTLTTPQKPVENWQKPRMTEWRQAAAASKKSLGFWDSKNVPLDEYIIGGLELGLAKGCFLLAAGYLLNFRLN